MTRLTLALTAALLLAGCHGGHRDQAAKHPPATAAEVEAGTTHDSADARLNALQRTKRKVHDIESQRKKEMDQALGGD